jgi:hypothetical protein
MSPVHIHLALNHAPVFGFAFVLALLVWGMIRRSADVQFVALLGCVAIALSAIPVYLTGEPAEDVAERLPGVTNEVIEAHEDAAKPAFVASCVTGVAALIGLALWRDEGRRRAIVRVVFVLCAVTALMIGRAAMLGGQIRHTEVRDGAVMHATDDDRESEDDRRGTRGD